MKLTTTHGGERLAATHCPCCGHPISIGADLRWHPQSRTLSGHGLVLMLSPQRTIIFDVLWRAYPTGRLIEREELMDAVYAGDFNGGPESDKSLSVQLVHLRKALAPFNLGIKSRTGCRLVILDATAESK